MKIDLINTKVESSQDPEIYNHKQQLDFLLGWIDFVKDVDEGFNMEIQRLLGIFEYMPKSVEDVANTRDLCIEELVTSINDYRYAAIGNRKATDFDWSSFVELSSDSEKKSLLDLMETDSEGLEATVGFLGGHDFETPSTPNTRVRSGTHSRAVEIIPAQSTGNSPRSSEESYESWNNAIHNALLDKGQNAYLGIVEENLANIDPKARGDERDALDSLISAVRSKINLLGNPFKSCLNEIRIWERSDPAEAPFPGLALLSVLCIAAGRMRSAKDRIATAYYKPLAELIGLPVGESQFVGNSYRAVADEIWKSYNSSLESIGLSPTARAVGRHRYVGVPISQNLFREVDRQKISAFLLNAVSKQGKNLDKEVLFETFLEWLNSTELSQACTELLSSLPGGPRDEATRLVFDSELKRANTMYVPGSSALPTKAKVPKLRLSRMIYSISALDYKLSVGLLIRAASLDSRSCSIEFISSEHMLTEYEAHVVDSSNIAESYEIEFQDVSPAAKDFLSGSIYLHLGEKTQTELTCSTISIFVFDPVNGFFVEKNRFDVNSRIHVLYDASSHQKLDSYLQKTSNTASFNVLNSSQVRDLPRGWKLAWDVTVSELNDELPTDLTGYLREEARASILFSQAPRITPYKDVWLEGALPTVEFETVGKAWVAVKSDGTGDDPPRIQFEDSLVMPLGRLVSGVGGYRIYIEDKDGQQLVSKAGEIVGLASEREIIAGSEPDSMGVTGDSRVITPETGLKKRRELHSGNEFDLRTSSRSELSGGVWGDFPKLQRREHFWKEFGKKSYECLICGKHASDIHEDHGSMEKLSNNPVFAWNFLSGLKDLSFDKFRSHLMHSGFQHNEITRFTLDAFNTCYVDIDSDLKNWQVASVNRIPPLLISNEKRNNILLGGTFKRSTLLEIETQLNQRGIELSQSAQSHVAKTSPAQTFINDINNIEFVCGLVKEFTGLEPVTVQVDTERFAENMANEKPASYYLESLDWHQTDDLANRQESQVSRGRGRWHNYRLHELLGIGLGFHILIEDGHRQAFITREQHRFFRQMFMGDSVLNHQFPHPLIIPRHLRFPGFIERRLFLEAMAPMSHDGPYRYYKNISPKTAEQLQALILE